MLLILLKGRKSDLIKKSKGMISHHMVNISLASATTIGEIISASINSSDSITLSDIDVATGNADFGFLSQVTPGQYMTWILSLITRRFWLGAALCTGTQMLESECQLMCWN